MNAEVKKESRNYGLDIIRVIAVILVLTVHFFGKTKYYSTSLTGVNMRLQSVIRNFCMSCVPLFMILTGFLNKKRQYNKSFFLGLFKIVIVWLFFSVLEFYILNVLNKTTYNLNFTNLLSSITSFKACNYSWYIEMYIGLYIIAPIINNAYDNFDFKNRKILCILFILMGSLPSFLNSVFKNIIHFPNYWTNIWIITYYICGKYIADVKPHFETKKLLILLMFNQIFIFSTQYIMTINHDTFPIFINTILIFLLFYDMKIKNNIIQSVFRNLSNLSLDIYLASSLVDQIIYPMFGKLFNFNIMKQQQIIIYAPIILIVVFIISTILGIVRKILINIR